MGMHIDGKKRANFYTFLHSLLIGRSRAETESSYEGKA